MAPSRIHADPAVLTSATGAVRELTTDEAQEYFDEEARATVGMSGAEFLRRWDAGEFDAIEDDPRHPEIMRLIILAPLVR